MKKINIKFILFLFGILCSGLVLLEAKNTIIISPVPKFKKYSLGIGFDTKPNVSSKGNKISTDVNTKKSDRPVVKKKGKNDSQKTSLSPFFADVAWVYDGDSLKVQSNNKYFIIRLFGIDAPEKSQKFGKASLKNLIKLVRNKKVYVVPVDKDKYQRIVAKIYVSKVVNKKKIETYINLEQIKNGYAWHYKRYAKKEKSFAIAEQLAKKAKYGLWVQDNPMKPELFRISIKKAKKNKNQ